MYSKSDICSDMAGGVGPHSSQPQSIHNGQALQVPQGESVVTFVVTLRQLTQHYKFGDSAAGSGGKQ